MKRIRIWLSLITLLLVSYTLSANEAKDSLQENPPVSYQQTLEAARLQGRDFVRLGELQTISGTLKPDRGEWFLHTEDAVYEIHLGDHNHRAETSIELEEGKKAEILGYVYHQEGHLEIDIAVCTMRMDGKEYRFREWDGTPLWRGRGGLQEHDRHPESERRGD